LSGEAAAFSEGLEVADGVHDFEGQFLVDGLEAGFGAGAGFGAQMCEGEGGAVFDADRSWAGQVEVAAPGLEGAEDSDRDDRGGGFDDSEADAGACGLDFAVWRAGAFGEQEDGAAGEEPVQDGAESGGAAAIAVDGHHIDPAEEASEDGLIEEVLAGEVIEVAVQAGTDHGGVDETGVIGGEDDWSGSGDVFGVMVAAPEVGEAHGAEEDPTDPVGWVHDSGNRGRRSWRMRAVVSSAVSCELLMTLAPRATMRGAVARWLSRWSRAARFSVMPSAVRRRVRSSREASR